MQELFANLMIIGWVPVVVILFALMPARNAVLWSYFLAAMFLPMLAINLPGLPVLDKFTGTAYGVLIATLIFDYGRLTLFRPSWIDVPILMFTVIGPAGASLTNGLGPYDAVSSTFDWSVTWLLPWFIGRLYFKTLRDVQTLAVAFMAAAIVYIPICWFELKMSPQLHNWIYGFHQTHFIHAIRFFGFRPRGFMQSELMLGLWVSASALMAYCMWRGRFVARLGPYAIPLFPAFLALGLTAFICQTVGAFVLAVGGLGMIVASTMLKTRVFAVALLMVAPTFVFVRATGLWDAQNAVDFVTGLNEDKGGSLAFRVENDNLLAKKAMQQPIFGWGGNGRNIAYREDGSGNRAVTDGMWIILFGKMGVVGLMGFMLAIALPMILFIWRHPPGRWLTPALAPVVGLVVMLALYQVDCLLNAMENPVYLLIAGSVAGMLAAPQPVPRRVPRPAPATRWDGHDPTPRRPEGLTASGVAGRVGDG